MADISMDQLGPLSEKDCPLSTEKLDIAAKNCIFDENLTIQWGSKFNNLLIEAK